MYLVYLDHSHPVPFFSPSHSLCTPFAFSLVLLLFFGLSLSKVTRSYDRGWVVIYSVMDNLVGVKTPRKSYWPSSHWLRGGGLMSPPSSFLLTDDVLGHVQVFAGNQNCREFVGAKVIACPEDSAACIPSLDPHILSGPSSVTLILIHQETTSLSSNKNDWHGTESKDKGSSPLIFVSRFWSP